MVARNKSQRQPKRTQKSRPKVRAVRARKSGRPAGGMGGALADPRVRAWDQLLRDPCTSNLAYPCYGGLDTGYLIRTTDYFTPIITGGSLTNGPGTCDFVFQITPSNFSTTSGTVSTGAPTSGAALNSVGQTGWANFITSATVARYRAVAACVKWLPSGPYSTRSGTVAMGLIPGTAIAATQAFNTPQVRAMCQHYAPNGAEAHEVRFLPTSEDENFTTSGAPIDPGAASLLTVLTGVDSITTGTNTVTLNGSFEITICWEWTPAAAAGSITSSPKAPLPYTSQQVLATIGDLGSYVFQGVRTAASNPGVMRAAVYAGSQLLTNGVRVRATRGRSLM